jgi:hypothetical protein
LISSEIQIPELPLVKFPVKKADVSIFFGKNPKEIRNYRDSGVLFQAKTNELLFKLDTVASFLVQNGERIVIERFHHSTDADIRLFLLGSVFGALFHQKGLLPFHGSTVVRNNEAIIIGGHSGSGKSTLAASLISKGFGLLSDDISVIEISKTPFVHHGIPHLKLWKDVLFALGEQSNEYDKIRPRINKFRKPVSLVPEGYTIPLSKIVILNVKNTPGFKMAMLSGAEKFDALRRNIYRYRYLYGLGAQENNFRVIGELASKIDVLEMERPNSPLLLQEFAEFFDGQIG